MKKLKIIGGILFSLYFLAAVLVFIFQRDFMYFPSAETKHKFEVRHFSIDEETLNIIVLNKGKENAILYFGGNGESVEGNAASFSQIFSNHTVYLVNYRGYGGSTGVPTEEYLYADAEYLYDLISAQHHEISVIGRSLGSGVATFLASTRAIAKMVLITPYDSIQNIAQVQYPIFPIALLLKDKYDSASRVKDIISNTLIILAEHDVIIPAESSNKLIKKFPSLQVTVEIIEGTGHNNLSRKNKYYDVLRQFLEPALDF
jgi:pimeloyl-ACP methyl ester carboxylesterase